MVKKTHGIGIDFGTDSVRVALFSYESGTMLHSTSCRYPRWKEGLYCDASTAQFRQHPADYKEALLHALGDVLGTLSQNQRNGIGSIGVGATGSTVSPVNKDGVPLALLEEFSNDPHAMFYLWKDHSATVEAQRFTSLCKMWEVDYTKYQGAYSEEWFWAKIAFAGKKSPNIRMASTDWIELSDWIPLLLTGQMGITYRNQCASAHKALYNTQFGGLPSREFLLEFDEYASQIHDAYIQTPSSSCTFVGLLDSQLATLLQLPPDVIIGGSSLDAHAGAVGANIDKGKLISVLGTSAVHMTVLPYNQIDISTELTAWCGLGQDSIIPGYWGVESGQAAFGDVLSWFANMLSPFCENPELILPRLDTMLADQEKSSEVTALEWFNGRRYPIATHTIQGALLGLNLSTDATSVYGALVDGILFGLKRILDGMKTQGLHFELMIATGGIARKSPVLIQRLSTILNLPVLVLKEQETCALGAAIYGAVASQEFSSLQEAQKAMAATEGILYHPILCEKEYFEKMFARYINFTQAIEPTYKKNSKLEQLT